MTVFIEASTEPFAAEREDMRSDYRTDFANNANVRRPTRGFVMKENTYAIIRVMGADGNFIPVLDAAGEQILLEDGKAYTTFYSNFFIQTVSEQRQEKQQIVDTFGDSYIFFFGESPRFVQVQGMLLNTADFNWRAEFWDNYEKYFRGTKLVERGARLYLIYDDIIIEGYLVAANAQETAENRTIISFGFQMFVTGYSNISTIGDPHVPGYDEEMYRGVNEDAGVYQEGVDQYQSSSSADRALADEAILGASRTEGGESGSGRLMNDSLRDGTASAGDPATSSFQQRAAAAVGGADELRFVPAPTTGEGFFFQNIDEFVARGIQTSSRLSRDTAEMPSDDEWARASAAADSGIEDSTMADSLGQGADTMDREYWDTMGRGGRANNEIRDSGGTRMQGAGVRRDLGGSDMGDYTTTRSTSAAQQRDVPFGMTSTGGTLVG